MSFLDLIFICQIHLLQSQGLLQGHSSVQGQEQQHAFISLILKIISTSFFFNVLWFLFLERLRFYYICLLYLF
jgi:hypothetical protein